MSGKAGFEDDFVTFYNTHLGTACDGSGIGLKGFRYGDLTRFSVDIVKTQDGVISCTFDIRVPVTLKPDEVRKLCEDKLEDENGRIEILDISAFQAPCSGRRPPRPAGRRHRRRRACRPASFQTVDFLKIRSSCAIAGAADARPNTMKLGEGREERWNGAWLGELPGDDAERIWARRT